ncbi:hypothetical protein RND81_14G249300 [Saponaria officinalis]|uniref:DUF569 domain-containing protein n=1 Tax=Saponaria officinalis TaxID=3572 RepID=A0AAW1GRG2_SAPOF
MESLRNKKKLAVELKDRLGHYLVACDDRRSVKGEENPTRRETAQWIIKGEDPEKLVLLMSIYGKYLAMEGNTRKMIQVEDGEKGCNRRFRLEKTREGFPKVFLRPSIPQLDYYLMTRFDGSLKWNNIGRDKRLIAEALASWTLEIVHKPKPFIKEEEEEEDDDEKRGIVVQIGQLVNYNGWSRESSSSYVNSGKNVNHGNGNQINGGVDIRTVHGGQIVNVVKKT